MVTDLGAIIYGDTQELLVQTLLTDDFLERNYFEVNFKADMSKGWGEVVERQLALNQDVSLKTNIAYNGWKTDPALYQEWLNESDANKANELFETMSTRYLNLNSAFSQSDSEITPVMKEKQNLFKASLAWLRNDGMDNTKNQEKPAELTGETHSPTIK